MPKNPETGLPSNSGPENIGEKPEVSKQETSRIEITKDDLDSIKRKLEEYQNNNDYWNGLKLAANLKKLNLGEEIPIYENFLEKAIKYAEGFKDTDPQLYCELVRELRTLKPELEFDLKNSLEKLQGKIEENIQEENIQRGKWRDALYLNSLLKDLNPETKNILIEKQAELEPDIKKEFEALKKGNYLDVYLELASTVKSLNPDFQIDLSEEDAKKIAEYIDKVKLSGDWGKYTRLVNQYNEVFGTEISPQSKEEDKKTAQGETKTTSAEGKTTSETTPPQRRVAEKETAEAKDTKETTQPLASTEKETQVEKLDQKNKDEIKETVKNLTYPVYLQDPEKKLTLEDIEEGYGSAISSLEEFVKAVKSLFKEYRYASEAEILADLKERLINVGKYEENPDDPLYQEYLDFSRHKNIPREALLLAADYLIDKENKKVYLNREKQIQEELSKIDRRSLATSVEGGGILKLDSYVKIYEKDRTGKLEIKDKDILKDLKKAEVSYRLLRDACLDPDTYTKWKNMEQTRDALIEKNKGLINRRLEIEKTLNETKDPNEKEKLQKEYLEISSKLKEVDDLTQQILKEKYEFNEHFKNVLENFNVPSRITNDEERKIYEKLRKAKKLSFQELLNKSPYLTKEEFKRTEAPEEEGGKRGPVIETLTEKDKLIKRLEAAGIKEISMPDIEKYALEYVDLLDRRKGLMTPLKEMDFYEYVLVKHPDAARKILEQGEIAKLKEQLEQIAPKEKESQTKKVKEEKPVVQQQSVETKVGQEEKKPEESKKLKGRGRLSFMILWEMIEAFLKGFWNYLKKQKDKFKSILRGFKF